MSKRFNALILILFLIGLVINGLFIFYGCTNLDSGNQNKKKIKTCNIKGIDVSRHQGKINWAEVKKNGLSFCFIKASEGDFWTDPAFVYNIENAKKIGLIVGAYHYYRFRTDNSKQLKQFTNSVSKNLINLPPVIDIEYHSNELLRNKQYQREFISSLKDFEMKLQEYYGVRPIFYTDIKFYNELLKGEIDGPLWISDPRRISCDSVKPDNWLFWQYNIVGELPGIDSLVDLNVFSGSLEELKKLAGKK